MKNAKAYYKYWIAIILASAVISLLGCMPAREVEMRDVYETGGLYEENDTIVNGDTMFIWNELK